MIMDRSMLSSALSVSVSKISGRETDRERGKKSPTVLSSTLSVSVTISKVSE